MPHAAKPESGERLARDMRRIRESRNITVDDLHDETKIPQGLIETFEDKALFDHPQFNRVYLRSFVRTYANVIGIDAEVALTALEEALSDRYAGSLAAEYLGETPTEAATVDPDSMRKRDEPSAETGSISEEEFTPPAGISTTPESVADQEPESESAESEGVEEWTLQSPPQPKEPQTRTKTTAAVSGSRAAARRSASRYDDRRSGSAGKDRRWMGALVAVIVVAALVWIIVSVMGDRGTAVQETIGAADTAAAGVDTAALEPEVPASTRPMPTLGDTMNVYVIAAADRLDPIRVTIDDDLRRPYWLEQGDSMEFAPANRIVIEEQLDDIQLTIEGVEYPTDRRDDLGRVVITRDSVRTFFALNAGL